MTVFVAAIPSTPTQVGSEQNGSKQREMLRRMQAPRFVSPKGDVAWGMELYKVGLGIEYCVTDGMTEGWLQAAEPPVGRRRN